ncbi:hypothetical protein ACFQZO_30905 [Bradyrhizobium sp. GCM10027634]|uniref:hypothetical protein n=1 Tax=unclassified Bradyrhizobium TaxID=2631580 RepID=UPI00263AA1D9|nr:hypothetical protein [Bradyrhizobium sp. WYCCWR 12677]MDN5005271.1 hypothetical protein [Bradyrhizobium sp. WYCCWR 12677]
MSSATMSDDGKEFVVHTTGKYTGALELRFASDCVDNLIAALTSARGGTQPAASNGPLPTAAPAVVPNPDGAGVVAPGARGANNPDEVKFEIPRNCTISADNSGRGLVLFILNHRLERQAGYAFSPDAAKQLAGGLTKSADALLAQQAALKT